MKYRLPGIYLGNISMDLFMEYIKLEDLTDLGNINEYYKVSDRKKNRSAHKVEFGFDNQNYNFITYNIYNKEQIVNFVSSYFSYILGDKDPNEIDYTITNNEDITDLFFYDTLNIPSIYGLYLELFDNYGKETQYMIEVEFEDKTGFHNLKDRLWKDSDE